MAVLVGVAALAAPARAQAPGGSPGEPAPDGSSEPAPAPAEPAPAEPAPVKDPKLAAKWLVTGQQLVQKGDWLTSARRAADARASYGEAVAAFEKSLDAGDDLNTYARLADAEEKLGKIDLAARHYRTIVKVQAAVQAGIRPEVMKRATAKLEELSAKVGIITLRVKPGGATITIDGVLLGKAPLFDSLILMPGTYLMSFQADGYQPHEIELNVEAGSEAERMIALEAVQVVVLAPLPEPELPLPPALSRVPLYAGGGATAALLGTATVTGLLAILRHGTYVSRGATAAERADARSSGQALGLVADLTLGGGLIAGGFTAYWYLVKYKPAQQKRMERLPVAPGAGPASSRAARRDEAQSTKIDLIPWVQPDASGVTLVGAF